MNKNNGLKMTKVAEKTGKSTAIGGIAGIIGMVGSGLIIANNPKLAGQQMVMAGAIAGVAAGIIGGVWNLLKHIGD